jgi:hypothetical protein
VSNEIALIPTNQDIEQLRVIGSIALKSGFLPDSIRTVEQAIIILLKGMELGLKPLNSFSSIAVINGKPTLSAELMLALVYRRLPQASIVFLETTDKVCKIKAKRLTSDTYSTFCFTIEEARAAKLLTKSSWQNYPSAMLRARAISATCRALFPDCIMGTYTVDELAPIEVIEAKVVEDKTESLVREIGTKALLIKDMELFDKIEADLALHLDDETYLAAMSKRIDEIINNQSKVEMK